MGEIVSLFARHTSRREEKTPACMRGTAGVLPARNIFKQIYPVKGTAWVATSTPRKQTSSEIGEGGQKIMEEKADPIVAFSKPPPFPPVLGPLVALSLLETWVNRDSNDDR